MSSSYEGYPNKYALASSAVIPPASNSLVPAWMIFIYSSLCSAIAGCNEPCTNSTTDLAVMITSAINSADSTTESSDATTVVFTLLPNAILPWYAFLLIALIMP